MKTDKTSRNILIKVYKLIKEYPNCGYKLNQKIEADIICINGQKVYLKDHPEFWEEVVEYPIGTKVHNSQTNTIYTKEKDGWYKSAEKTAYTDEMIGSYKHLTLLGKSEEVIEKDYEILSFSYEDKVFTTLRDNGKYFSASSPNKFDPNGYFCGHTKEQELNFGGKVHSIKRLSDGEIFTVGDEFTSLGLRTYKISKIDFSTHPVHKDVIGLYFDDYQHILLKVAEHVKKSLFTTEDDVDIFVGDSYWVLNTKVNDWIFEENAARDNINYFYKDKSYASQTKIYYFSTKEAAEEYVLMNKPCLSVNDLLNSGFLMREELIKLVKSKL